MSRPQTTRKFEIIKTATEFIFSVGYSKTSPQMIAKKMNMSTGNITHYFPSKEHLLCTIVEMLCEFQWRMFEDSTEKGFGSIGSICMEMMTVATGCEQSEIARDFFSAVFESEMCRNYLRANHVKRYKQIFAKECEGWTDQDFNQAELMAMGLQYSTVAASDADVPLKDKISSALDKVLYIYQVDEETRKREIDKVMHLDYQSMSKQVIDSFIAFVNKTSNDALNEMKETIRKRERAKNKNLERGKVI
ncbi:MAG: TetR/AcrR family transcriptional regulator [Clostridia bacterium]|nr:TetR/AcrR family transcriptional regulator [Clostridia bacterium]